MRLTREIEFQASTENEAYTKARERLGPDGVILSIQSVKVPGLIPFLRKKTLLVRAGILVEDEPRRKPEPDPELERRQMAVFQALLEHRRKGPGPVQARDPADRLVDKAGDRVEIKGENTPVSPVPSCGAGESVEASGTVPREREVPPDPRIRELLAQEVSPTVAQGLVDEYGTAGSELTFRDWLAGRMDRVCASPSGDFLQALGGRRIMIVGPTGVGKTTSIAKLAAMALQSDLDVALFTSDNYRVSAVEQIRTFARVLRIPLEVVNSGSEIPALLAKYSAETLVIMDTVGHGFRETSRVNQISSVYENFRPDAVHAAVAATSRFRDVRTSVARVREAFQVSYLMLTKIDETTCPGALISLPVELDLPVSFVTTGQNVPRDIRLASGEFLAGKVFQGGEMA